MADYNSLAELLNTTANMTATRNNSPNDDGTDSVTGVSWFKLNNVVASTIYVNGNHWLGFGTNAEQLKVCRRDGKCYYVYREEGTIKGIYNFLKIRWEGYTRYNSTSTIYALKFEVFLLSTGHIFLNIIQAPTGASYMGTSQLVCGSNSYDYTVTETSQMPLYYSFYALDATGSAWQVANELMIVGTKTYASSGSSVFAFADIQAITDYASSTISWTASEPAGTSVKIYAAIGTTTPLDTDYTECTNFEAIPGIAQHADLSTKSLYIKAVLATTDTSKTPTLSSLSFEVTDDKYNTFVPLAESGKYKITCDLSNRPHGITVMNKKTSRLRFLSGEQLPVFSVHMFIDGQNKYIDGGYIYDPLSGLLDNLVPDSMTENAAFSNFDLTVWDTISESLAYPTILTSSAETTNITLI